ncbi:MAG: response regulator transcription factor [bacterium]|nr:response regulator transcription factor [bacterium]
MSKAESTLQILIADDHALFRLGMKALLAGHFGEAQIRVAEDGQQAMELIAQRAPDVVLTDIDMPRVDGFELVRQVKKTYPQVRVIAVSMHRREQYQTEMFKLDCDGYLTKDTSLDELLRAIDSVIHGERYVSEKLSNQVVSAPEETLPLTGREKEVLRLIADGLTSKEAADHLDLSVRTVESHRSRIMQKLHIENLAGLIRYALERGIASP